LREANILRAWKKEEITALQNSPFTSSVLGPNIVLSTLFSNTLSLHSSLNVSDQVSHPYKKTPLWSGLNMSKHGVEAEGDGGNCMDISNGTWTIF